MPNQTYTQAQYDAQVKRSKFAWAKYYQEVNDNLSRIVPIFGMLENSGVPRVQGHFQIPTTLPTHLTQEFIDMAVQLNKEYTCPCCMEIVNKDTIHITYCGHILCKQCFQQLVSPKRCPHCRKSL
jgi:hypothetical protein